MGLYNRILFVYMLGPFLRPWPPIKISGGLHFQRVTTVSTSKRQIAIKVSVIKVVGQGGVVKQDFVYL